MSRIKLKKLNDTEVKEIPNLTGGERDNRPVKGENVFSNPFCNVFLCAKKASGKSTVIFKIIKECTTRETHCYLFCSTIYKDDSWLQIRKYLDLKKIGYDCFTSIQEGGTDQLKEIIDKLDYEAKEAELNKDNPKPKKNNILVCDDDDCDDEEKKFKSKFKSPQYLFIFDDLSTQLQSESICALVKKNRHYKSCCLFSSQWLTDLKPSARLQLDYCLLFRAINIDKLKSIYKELDIGVSFETFIKIYNFATEKPYSFLYIDTNHGLFRKNFNLQIDIQE